MDAEIARRLQEEEDEEIARTISSDFQEPKKPSMLSDEELARSFAYGTPGPLQRDKIRRRPAPLLDEEVDHQIALSLQQQFQEQGQENYVPHYRPYEPRHHSEATTNLSEIFQLLRETQNLNRSRMRPRVGRYWESESDEEYGGYEEPGMAYEVNPFL